MLGHEKLSFFLLLDEFPLHTMMVFVKVMYQPLYDVSMSIRLIQYQTCIMFFFHVRQSTIGLFNYESIITAFEVARTRNPLTN